MIYCIDNDSDTLTDLQRVFDSASLRTELFKNADQFLENYKMEDPGCVVFDISATTAAGELLQSKLTFMPAGHPYLALSNFTDFESAAEVMRQGAFDFIEKPIKHLALLRSVNAALRESKAHFSIKKRRARLEREIDALQKKDKIILRLLLKRKSTKEIASEMNMAGTTVDNYRSRLIGKVGLNSYLDYADAYCIMGLCTPDDKCSTAYFDDLKFP